MPLHLTIRVFDINTSQPIPSARIFIDGVSSISTETDLLFTSSSGSRTILLTSPGTHRVQVKADGFKTADPFPFDVTVPADAVQSESFNIGMTSTAIPKAIIKFLFNPAIPGIVWTLVDSNSMQVDKGPSEIDGTSVSHISLPFGDYTLTANLVGYETTTQTITIDGLSSPYPVKLIKTVDGSSQQTGTSGAVPVPNYIGLADDSNALATTVPDPTEFIYPNTDYEKYFTSIGVRVYIGNLFIDEVFSLQYTLQDNAIPTYGYASRFPDAYAQGRSLVQGQLVLNFVTEGYLFTVMQEYNKYFQMSLGSVGSVDSATQTAVINVLSMYAKRDALLRNAKLSQNISASAARAATINANTLDLKIDNQLGMFTADQIQLLSRTRSIQATSSFDTTGYTNAVYQDVIFDIREEFGNETTGVKRTRLIEKAKLISNEQVVSNDGQIILDSYGFLARRLR